MNPTSVPLIRTNPARGLPARPGSAAYRWHRSLPGYRPTPLVPLPEVAEALGLSQVLAKDETTRFGLPSFKILGVSWAVHSALPEYSSGATTLVAATDGNHGRAVARTAADNGWKAHIYVPRDMARARIDAIAAEGATVDATSADYDRAVAAAAGHAAHAPDTLLVTDTAYEPDEVVPRSIIDGYATLFWEIGAASTPAPDLVVVPVGSGSLAAAAARHVRAVYGPDPLLVAVEPSDAACAMASLGHSAPVAITSRFRSRMVGLNVGRMSATAWPDVSAGFDLFVAIDDDWCTAARRALVAAGVPAGDTGSASLAGLMAVRSVDRAASARTALVLATEGPTDQAPPPRF